MIKKILVFCFVSCLIIHNCFANDDFGRIQVVQVFKSLYKTHTNPPPLNSDFSKAVYDKIIDDLDPSHIYFTIESLETISAYRNSLDKEINGTSWTFFGKLVSIYKTQLEETDSILNIVLSHPISVQKGSTITLPHLPTFHPTNFSDKKNYLTSYYKNRMMRMAYFEKPDDSIKDPLLDKTFETRIREELLQDERAELKELLGTQEEIQKYVLDKFCNSIAKCFDPHSDFMPPAAREKFIQEVSAEQFTFGIELEINEKDEFVISGLLAGGPAWETGEIQKGDVVVEIKHGNKKTVDLESSEISDIYDLMDKIDDEDLYIKVRKTDGKVVNVELNKKVVADEESIVKSFILKGENRIGFISLPAFYSDFSGNGGKTCSNDVAKEIWKLKKDSIDGLMIDLRYNGGGSVTEAVDMTGIFINEGVVCSEKKGNNKPILHKDPNRGTSYDGPLLFLVNGQSASAAELLPGALQDYNRAIIVGGQTYGKATAQVVIPADTNQIEKALLGMKTEDKPKNGFIKVTIGRIYLPTGRTIQCSGVIPDIILPDLYDSLNIREKDQPYCIQPDSIKKALYFSPLDELPIKQISERSKLRVEKNIKFNNNQKFSGYYHSINESSRNIPLDWAPYVKLKKSDKTIFTFLNLSGESDSLNIFVPENISYDKDRVNTTEERKESNEEWFETLRSDIYINESYLILKDYLEILNSKTNK